MKLSFLTNGYGEDRTGALIACELRKLAPRHPIIAVPMVSNGNAFQNQGFETVWEGAFPPGQGFGSQEFRLFLKDIPYARDYFRYLGFLFRRRSEFDHAFVVGDVFLLIHAYFGLGRKAVFLALAKSDHMNPHSGVEEWVIRHFASHVLTRDAYTAAAAAGQRHGCPLPRQSDHGRYRPAGTRRSLPTRPPSACCQAAGTRRITISAAS